MSAICPVVRMLLAGLAALGTTMASSQTYPVKTIRIVTAQPGGGTDFVARLIAQGLSSALGQSVIVDNRPAIIQGEIVSKAPPDGYTLLVVGESLWVQSLLQKVPYDPLRDFTPITLVTSSPNVLVVHPSLPVKSVKELIAFSKARPGQLNYGSSGVGASAHLAAELFRGMTRVDIVHVPYKGTAGLSISLMSGHVELAFITITAVAPILKTGKLRALAVTSAKPSPLVPALPTVAETVPGYVSGGEVAVFAPPGTPAAIVGRLNPIVVQFVNTAATKERLFSAGFEVFGSSPEELAAWVKAEMARWGKVIKDAGMRGQ